jgi:hypothetical protein
VLPWDEKLRRHALAGRPVSLLGDRLPRAARCWVTAGEHGRFPALLLESRETPDGSQGRVVRPVLVIEDETRRPREGWLPAEDIGQA